MTPEAKTENRLWITEGGGVAMCVNGNVIVRPIANWHALEAENAKLREALENIIASGDDFYGIASAALQKGEGE